MRWFLADAFEQLDRPDSAAAYLERIWDQPFRPPTGPDKPWAHRRLALLYARLGRIPDAERHLAAAEKALGRPDPAVRKMLEEARVAVAGAKGESGVLTELFRRELRARARLVPFDSHPTSSVHIHSPGSGSR